MVAQAITPDYALGGHTASLGLCWLPAGTLAGFPDGTAIGEHGSSAVIPAAFTRAPLGKGCQARSRVPIGSTCNRTSTSRSDGS